MGVSRVTGKYVHLVWSISSSVFNSWSFYIQKGFAGMALTARDRQHVGLLHGESGLLNTIQDIRMKLIHLLFSEKSAYFKFSVDVIHPSRFIGNVFSLATHPLSYLFHSQTSAVQNSAGLILCMRPTNERRRYNVTSSLIGWAHMIHEIRSTLFPVMVWRQTITWTNADISSNMSPDGHCWG